MDLGGGFHKQVTIAADILLGAFPAWSAQQHLFEALTDYSHLHLLKRPVQSLMYTNQNLQGRLISCWDIVTRQHRPPSTAITDQSASIRFFFVLNFRRQILATYKTTQVRISMPWQRENYDAILNIKRGPLILSDPEFVSPAVILIKTTGVIKHSGQPLVSDSSTLICTAFSSDLGNDLMNTMIKEKE